MIVRAFPLVALVPLLLLGGCSPSSAPDTAVGTLEMVEVDVGPLQPARALRVMVQEGDVVQAGDTLVLFTTPTLASSTAQAEARAVAAQEASRELASGARPAEISRAQADLRAAEADADRTAADLARLEPLAAKGDVSRASLDGVRAASRVAAGRRDAAREALRLIQDGARRERRQAAAAEARGAQAAADGWRATANDLVLLAPVAGVVSSRNVEPGEVMAAGQSAITVAQPSRPWARIYVSQFVLPTLHPGDSLSARLDGDTTLFRGRISAIATRAEFTPRVALTDQERADLLFGVKVEFADSTQRLRAGMPISVLLPRTRK
ncbi:HlyD family efflux transporter periplasmic adaptor subunit [Gemmatimonas sp.]|uniref:HlyD family secretion protein n=1 Tax=Gemmatimonas sp. TaxID=1962908 RepID=UPI00286A5E11|nr:HlyD family efflux transporter periplasmic adaptor subunit [Gemmatimonas sp.]